MKLLKVFGIVVGIHVFALILIFANPGCSSTSQPAPTETTAKAEPGAAPITLSAPAASDSPISSAPINFDPNATAVASSTTIRFSPTRPNTPAAGALEAEPVSDVTPASTYTVGKGDSLWTIAKKNHVTVSELAAANNLKAGASVRMNQKLIIPGKAGSPVSPAAKTSTAATPSSSAKASAPLASVPMPSDTVKHTVKPGETLGAIARKYGVKMGDLATANNIADPAKIHPGMELVVPGWQAPASKSGKSTSKTASTSQAPLTIPTISVSDPSETKPASDAPIISVDEAPAPKKP